MTWWRTTLIYYVAVLMLTGCTIKVEPLEKKPVKVYKHKTVKRHSHPSVTPTPAPHTDHGPMLLEPTESPTPVIHIPPTALANQWSMLSV
jgi:hypothetical protein